MNKEAIIIDGLTKQFKNTLAVKNISFKINKGKIIGLLGPNGCGKSTTIGMILGLIKPSSGTVIINGQNIEHNRTDLLEKMNFISKFIHNIFCTSWAKFRRNICTWSCKWYL